MFLHLNSSVLITMVTAILMPWNRLVSVARSLLLSLILYDGDLDESYANFLVFVAFVHLQCKSLTEHQSIVEASGPHEASIMRCVARSPALIQFESDVILTRVERVACFRRKWFEANTLKGRSGVTFHTDARRAVIKVQFVPRGKTNNSDTIWHTICDIAVSSLSDAHVMCDRDLNCQRHWISECTCRNHGNL